MTIGIDARMLGKGFGLARYVEQLVVQLAKQSQDIDVVLFVQHTAFDTHAKLLAQFSTIVVDIPWYSLSEQLFLSRIIRKAKIDLMHFPHFNVPLLYHGKFIMTMHDLTMFHFPRPEATTRSKLVFQIKDLMHRWVIRSAVRRAVHIITASEYVQQDIHQTLGVPLDKMTTVYQAPYRQVASGKEQQATISQPYVLYVGAAYPHKNISGLLDAWERYEGDGELVLVGQENYFWNRLLPRIKTYANVRYLGFQTDEQLDELYANARAFVWPSLSEGFGIPPLEAMQRGVPVLSSSASCMPEILGEGALYTDATNPTMFASAIETILHDDDVRHQLLMNSKTVLSQYSPERFGRETWAIYNNQL